MLSHRALWPPSPHTSRYQKTQPRTSYFICIKLNTWHVCMFSPEPSPLPDIFYCPLWPLSCSEAQKVCGAYGPGALQHPLHLSSQLRTPKTACRCFTPKQLRGMLASFCPSTQQLGHLLTPGDTAVHSEGSLLCPPVNSLIPHAIMKRLLSARSWTKSISLTLKKFTIW